MKRTNQTDWQPAIDTTYENQVSRLDTITGNINDYAIEPAKSGPVVQRPTPTAVLPHSSVTVLSPQEATLLSQSGQMAAGLMNVPYQPVNSADARQVDSAVTRDKASLMYSLAYALPALLITAGLLLIVWLFQGGGLGGYFFTGLVVWGVAVMGILYHNRGQGLHHSPSGIAHHDIDARVEEAEIRADVAKHAIDAHIALLKHKWTLTDKKGGEKNGTG